MIRTILTRACTALLFLALAAHPMPSEAQTAPPGLVGTWNAPGGELSKVVIAQEGAAYTLHAWGSCSPTPCDWGTVPLGMYAKNVSAPVAISGMAAFTTSFAIKTVIIRLDPRGRLQAETFTNFTDHSARSCYDVIQLLHR